MFHQLSKKKHFAIFSFLFCSVISTTNNICNKFIQRC